MGTEALAVALPDLTSEAVKLAVFVIVRHADDATVRADVAWCGAVAREVGLTPAVVRKCLRELADSGLVALSGRVNLTRVGASMSQPPLRAVSAGPLDTDVTESEPGSPDPDSPPWERSATRSVASQGMTRDTADSGDSSSSGDSSKELSPLQQATATFDALYRAANDGSKPTWDGRAIVLLRQLVDKHGVEEVERRTRIMFEDPPKWPPPPYDITSLRFHFDRFAKPGSRKGGMVDRWKGGKDYYSDDGSTR